MSGWKFPNAIALSVRRSALQRGQTASRVVPLGDGGPIVERVVREGDPCESYPRVARCYQPLDGAYCPGCGRLVSIG